MFAPRQVFVLLGGCTFALATHEIVLPTAPPAITSNDPWQCATEYLPQYFEELPKPTGALSTALLSYGNQLQKPCRATATARRDCPFPDPSVWCAFSTAASPTILPAWSTYASNASFWWSAHSSAAVSLAKKCPIGWYNAMSRTPGGSGWLNNTIVAAECYAKAHGGNITPLITSSLTSTKVAATPVTTPSPIQSGVISTCNKFDRSGNDPSINLCERFAQRNSVSLYELYAWNTILGPRGENCSTQFKPLTNYCTGVQNTCVRYGDARPGGSCAAFASRFDITLDQFYAWNPMLGPNGEYCETEFLPYHSYCVEVDEGASNVSPTPLTSTSSAASTISGGGGIAMVKIRAVAVVLCWTSYCILNSCMCTNMSSIPEYLEKEIE